MNRIQFPASPWIAADTDNDTCCDGRCNDNQGRGSCPLYQQDEPPVTFGGICQAAFIVAVIVGFVLAGPMAMHFIAQFI